MIFNFGGFLKDLFLSEVFFNEFFYFVLKEASNHDNNMAMDSIYEYILYYIIFLYIICIFQFQKYMLSKVHDVFNGMYNDNHENTLDPWFWYQSKD